MGRVIPDSEPEVQRDARPYNDRQFREDLLKLLGCIKALQTAYFMKEDGFNDAQLVPGVSIDENGAATIKFSDISPGSVTDIFLALRIDPKQFIEKAMLENAMHKPDRITLDEINRLINRGREAGR